MNNEFNTLLAAKSSAHAEYCGAVSMQNAVYQHLGDVGHKAARRHLARLRAVYDQADAALEAYMHQERQFNAAAYEAQQRSITHLQAP